MDPGRPLIQRTGTPLTPHGIRRACATHMLNRGAHPVQLQMLLGHASLKHLSQYLRVTFREIQARSFACYHLGQCHQTLLCGFAVGIRSWAW